MILECFFCYEWRCCGWESVHWLFCRCIESCDRWL